MAFSSSGVTKIESEAYLEMTGYGVYINPEKNGSITLSTGSYTSSGGTYGQVVFDNRALYFEENGNTHQPQLFSFIRWNGITLSGGRWEIGANAVLESYGDLSNTITTYSGVPAICPEQRGLYMLVGHYDLQSPISQRAGVGIWENNAWTLLANEYIVNMDEANTWYNGEISPKIFNLERHQAVTIRGESGELHNGGTARYTLVYLGPQLVY